MPSTSSVRAGRAYVELGVNDNLQAGLSAAEKKLKAFGAAVGALGRQLATIGGVSLGGLVAMATAYADDDGIGAEMAVLPELTACGPAVTNEAATVGA